MIFSDVPDPRLVAIRRGGTLMDADHHLLALCAADCTEYDEVGYADVRVRGLHG